MILEKIKIFGEWWSWAGSYPAKFIAVLLKAHRFLSSGSALDIEILGPGLVGMVISGQNSIQLAYCLCLQRQEDL